MVRSACSFSSSLSARLRGAQRGSKHRDGTQARTGGKRSRADLPGDESLGLVDVGRAERAELGNLEALEVGQVTLFDSPAQIAVSVTLTRLVDSAMGGRVGSLSHFLNHVRSGEAGERLDVLERLLVNPGIVE